MISKHTRNLAVALVSGAIPACALVGMLVYGSMQPPSRHGQKPIWKTCKIVPHDREMMSFDIVCQRENGSTGVLWWSEKDMALERPEILYQYRILTRADEIQS